MNQRGNGNRLRGLPRFLFLHWFHLLRLRGLGGDAYLDDCPTDKKRFRGLTRREERSQQPARFRRDRFSDETEGKLFEIFLALVTGGIVG
jgi:hypothetical protein